MSSPIHDSESGYSLVEIMVALGICSIVLVGIASLVSSFMASEHAIRDTVDLDEEAIRLQYYFTRPFRTAVNLQRNAGSIDTYALPNSAAGVIAFKGQILDGFDSATLPNSNSITTALMVFARDKGFLTTAPAQGLSDFQPVGVYFQQPSATTFGILYVNEGSTGGVLKPSKSGSFATNITRLVINDIVMDSSNVFVKSFTVNVEMRYPSSVSEANLVWCPVANPCAGGAPAKDVKRSFTVVLNNNFDPAASMATQMGRVYFLGRGL